MSIRWFAFAAPVFAGTLALPLWLAPPGGGEACRRAAEARVESEAYDRAIFFAVLEGLYTDGVQTEVVERIVEIDPESKYPANFVYACPICMPAYDAFAAYRARPGFIARKDNKTAFGDGLASEEVRALTSGPLADRHAAIQRLVQRWMDRYVDSRRFNDEERARWRQAMEERRKKGMATLVQYRAQGFGASYREMKQCPFCEAANG
jgi:hypothetical protein